MSAVQGEDIKKVDFKLPIQIPEGAAVRVNVGDVVKPGEVVADFKEPDLVEINLVSYFNIKNFAEGKKLLKKQKGDLVNVDDVLAEKSTWMGKKVQLKSSYEGVLEDFADSGIVVIKRGSINHEITSPIGGKVATVVGTEIEVATEALHWQGVFGVGNARWGDLLIWERNEKGLRLEDVDIRVKDKVLLINSVLPHAFWYKACTMGVAGIICSEIPSNFETWRNSMTESPAVIAIRNDGDLIPERVVQTFAKLKYAFAFLIPANSEIVVIDNRG